MTDDPVETHTKKEASPEKEKPIETVNKPPKAEKVKQEVPEAKATVGEITAISARLKKALGTPKPPVNRSGDLTPLSHDFYVMMNRLRALIAAMEHQQTAMETMDKSRMAVSKLISVLSEKSPIFDQVGRTKKEEGEVSNSYASVNLTISNEARNYITTYRSSVIDYVKEWEKVITQNIETDEKEVNSLNNIFLRRERKVNYLRMKINVRTKLAINVPDKMNEKVERNQVKLDKAWEDHERKASELCEFIEEVTKRGWKDLYPLVTKMATMDSEMITKESKLFAELKAIMDVVPMHLENSSIHEDASDTSIEDTTEDHVDSLKSVSSEEHEVVHAEEDIIDPEIVSMSVIKVAK